MGGLRQGANASRGAQAREGAFTNRLRIGPFFAAMRILQAGVASYVRIIPLRIDSRFEVLSALLTLG
jgi:hypothetical protein